MPRTPWSVIVLLAACSGDGGTATGDDDDDVTLPDVAGVTFVDGVTNPYLPMPVGATWTYETQTDEGLERVEVVVLPDTKVIQGVTATVVQDQAFLDDVLTEDTDDWFAQDADGNVWYLGEDTCEIEDGNCVNTQGAWEWGVDGALPGVVMWATPTVDGQPYYQEYSVGEAEDVGEVVELDVSVTVPAGSYTGCVKTRETSTLETDALEFKTYCAGVGQVLGEEDENTEELQTTTGL
jgi:hypothetical protein